MKILDLQSTKEQKSVQMEVGEWNCWERPPFQMILLHTEVQELLHHNTWSLFIWEEGNVEAFWDYVVQKTEWRLQAWNGDAATFGSNHISTTNSSVAWRSCFWNSVSSTLKQGNNVICAPELRGSNGMSHLNVSKCLFLLFQLSDPLPFWAIRENITHILEEGTRLQNLGCM